LEKVNPLKFYYLDDEQELISITSQSDFIEALEIDDLANLKLTVADNANEARMILEKQIDDNMSLAGSMKGFQPPAFGASFNNRVGTARIDTMSELLQEPVEERRCETERAATQKMEDVANNFIDKVKSMFSEVKSYVQPGSTEAETVAQVPLNMPVPEEKPQVPEMIDTSSKKAEPAPVVDEEHFMKCTWCNGAGCKKCRGQGKFSLKGLDEQVAAAKEEVKKLCELGLKNAFDETRKKRTYEQAFVKHDDYICDACDQEIVGIRYKCTMREDYDICEKCEAKGVDSDYTFLKIRRPQQAPAKFVCKYPHQTAPFQMPDMHIDQVINVDDLTKQFSNFCKNFTEQKEDKPQQADLKMPEMPKEEAPKAKAEPKKGTCGHVDEDYELEDVSVVEEMSICQGNPLEEQQQPVNLEQPILSELKDWTPKPEVQQELSKDEIYKLEAAAETGYMNVALLQLLDLGFNDFNRNKQLLEKFNLNVEAVASAILEDDELYN